MKAEVSGNRITLYAECSGLIIGVEGHFSFDKNARSYSLISFEHVTNGMHWEENEMCKVSHS